jgi:hypothetical protein
MKSIFSPTKPSALSGKCKVHKGTLRSIKNILLFCMFNSKIARCRSSNIKSGAPKKSRSKTAIF